MILSQDPSPVYHRYRATVEYNGAGFAGWQQQRHQQVSTIQGVLEVALFRYCGEVVKTHAAGRTDTGVHATGQVIHFDMPRHRDSHQIARAVNYHLRPNKVVLRDVQEVSPDFHARFSAKQRQYQYHILNRPTPSALLDEYAWHVPKLLDINRMHQAAQSLVGTHNFTSFRSVHCSARSAIRTIDFIEVHSHLEDTERIVISIGARSFLHNQVRIIVGHLYQAGIGKYTADDILGILAARDRTQGTFTAPAHGLYLTNVVY